MEIENIDSEAFKSYQKALAERIQLLMAGSILSQHRWKREERAWLVHTHPEQACGVSLAAQFNDSLYSTIDIKF